MSYVYVLKSLVRNIHYTGQTENLFQRLKQHNAGKTKFTKSARPWKIVHYEMFETREKAVEREVFLKTGIGREFIRKTLYQK